MTIVAEQVGYSPEMAAALPPEMKELYEDTRDGGAFMCAYTEDGKFNLGSAEEFVVLERFEARALSVMRTSLKLTNGVRVLNDTRRGGEFPKTGSGTGCLVVVGAAPLVVYGISEAIQALL